LADALADLCRHRLIAVDLEADSMFHFKEKICLIQIATETSSYIIDPLSIPDLSTLSEIFSNPDMVKILHGADYDIRSLHRDYGITIANLFDTEMASRFLGNAETGLNTVLQKRFGVFLEKKYQKKDWSQRPLPAAMIEYAAKDTQYLIPLYGAHLKELTDKGRLEWVLEECRDLTLVRSSSANERPLFLKVKGAGRLDPRSLAVLETLLEFRRTLAEAKDRPLFKVMGTAALIKIAIAQPATLEQLIETRVLSEKQINMYGPAMVKRIRDALDLPADALPRYPRFRTRRISNEESARLKRLRQWREQKAKNLEIDSGVLINNAALSAIAEADPKTSENLNALPMLKNWQKKALGPDILSVLAHSENR